MATGSEHAHILSMKEWIGSKEDLVLHGKQRAKEFKELAANLGIANVNFKQLPGLQEQLRDLECGYRIFALDRNKSSILYHSGVILGPKEPDQLTPLEAEKRAARKEMWHRINSGKVKPDEFLPRYFVCLVLDCGDAGGRVLKLAPKSTGAGTNHLRYHKISREVLVKKRVAKECADEPAMVKKLRISDPWRWSELVLALIAAHHATPFNQFKSEPWGLLIGVLPGYRPGVGFNPRKPIIELYQSTKERVKALMKQSKEAALGLPFCNMNVDLYTSAVQGKKYAAFRLNFVAGKKLWGVNLGVRRYAPSLLAQEAGSASEILARFVREAIADFGVGIDNDVFSSTSDFGPDVRAAVGTHMPSVSREWCVSHLLHLCLVDAFGAQLDKNKSKNKEARQVFDVVRKTIEVVSKSEKLKALVAAQGQAAKLKNHPAHRWGAAADTLRSLLQQWDAVCNVLNQSDRAAPLTGAPTLANLHEVLMEFYSVLHEVRFVQILAQRTQSPSVFKTFLTLHKVYATTANPSAPLMIHRLGRSVQDALRVEKDVDVRAADVLDERTTAVRTKLRAALDKRFFARYNPLGAFNNPRAIFGSRSVLQPDDVTLADFKFSYGFDLAAFFTPHNAFKMFLGVDKAIDSCGLKDDDLMGFNRTLDARTARHVLKYCMHRTLLCKVLDLAEVVAQRRCGELVVAAPSPQSNVGTEEHRDMEFWSDLQVEEPKQTDATPQTPRTTAWLEMSAYLDDNDSVDLKDVPNSVERWWHLHKQKYPILSTVFFAVAVPFLASSGGLECDLGSMKDVLQPKRASLGPGFVEASMFIKLNYRHVSIEETANRGFLDAGELGRALPKAFTGDKLFVNEDAEVGTGMDADLDESEGQSDKRVDLAGPAGGATTNDPKSQGVRQWTAWALEHQDVSAKALLATLSGQRSK